MTTPIPARDVEVGDVLPKSGLTIVSKRWEYANLIIELGRTSSDVVATCEFWNGKGVLS